MSDDRPQTHDCLDAETLAAFIDGRLESREREVVEAHLAACEDCYEVWMDAARGLSSEDSTPVQRDLSGRLPRFLVPLTSIAAAGLLAAAGFAWWAAAHNIEARTTVALSGPERSVAGRLSDDPGWRPLVSPTRGQQARPPVSAEAQIAISEIEIAVRTDRSPRTLWAYGKTRLALHEFDVAIASFEEARQTSSTPELLSDLGVAYFNRALATGHNVDLPAALDAISEATSVNAPPLEAWFNKALVCEALEQIECAADSWRRYLQQDPDSKWAEEARRGLARVTERKSPDSDAGMLLDQLLDRELPGIVGALSSGSAYQPTPWSAASTLVDRITSVSADSYSRDVLRHARAHTQWSRTDSFVRGVALWAQARAAMRDRNLALARTLMEPAAQYLQRSGSPLVLSARLYVGVLAERRQEYRVADGILATVSHDAGQRGYLSIEGRAKWTRGLVLLSDGRMNESAAVYRSAHEVLRRAGELDNAGFVAGLLATNYDSQGDVRQSWQYRVHALRETRRSTVFLRASAEAARSNWNHAAVEFADTALMVTRSTSDAVGIASALRRLARANARLNRVELAKTQLTEARGIVATLANVAKTRLTVEIDLAEAEILGNTDSEAAVAAAERAIRHFESAVPVAEERLPEVQLYLGKALSALQRPAEAEVAFRRGLDVYSRIRTHQPTGADQLSLAEAARGLTEALVGSDARQSAEQRLQPLEALRAWDLTSTPNEVPPPIKELLRRIPAKSVVLSYLVGRSESLLWILTRDNAHIHTIPIGEASITTVIRDLQRPEDRDRARRQLSELLLGPALSAIKEADHVGVLPDGPLHGLPFGALVGIEKQYLIQERSVVVGASLRHLTASRAAGHVPGVVLAVGDPAFDPTLWPGLETLPDAMAEARIAADNRGIVLDGPRATRSEVLRALPHASTMHFAGHSIDNRFHAHESSLVLAGPDRLRAGEIRDLSLEHLSLVVLSSCNSSVGPSFTTDGPLGLARAFIAAGTGMVVATRRPVADVPTHEFFGTFYRSLNSGSSPVDALRAAQVAAISSGSAFEHWSSFFVFGNFPRANTPSPKG